MLHKQGIDEITIQGKNQGSLSLGLYRLLPDFTVDHKYLRKRFQSNLVSGVIL